MQSPTLACEGQLVATVEVADTYGYDSDRYDHIFLFKSGTGYELLVVGRSERYDEQGSLERAFVSVDLASAPSADVLQEIVETRWSASSAVWWQLLEGAREHDEMLHKAWVPERMRRDLDRSSVYDQTLALRTGYYGGQELAASGRAEDGWQERTVAAVGALLMDRGWVVRPGPELSRDVEPARILSPATRVVGSLWATRYGHEVPVVIRVDDCGEIYPRLADPDDLVHERGCSHALRQDHRAGAPQTDLECEAGAGVVRLGDAIEIVLGQLGPEFPGPGFGL